MMHGGGEYCDDYDDGDGVGELRWWWWFYNDNDDGDDYVDDGDGDDAWWCW